MNEINKILDPVDKSFELFRFVSNAQMFENCNKRTATIIANVPLIKNDIALFYPSNNLYNEFTSILTQYYVNPTKVNIKKCDRFMKENFLNNQELDAKRKEQGYHMLYDYEVEEILDERKERLSLAGIIEPEKYESDDYEDDMDM